MRGPEASVMKGDIALDAGVWSARDRPAAAQSMR